MGEIRELLCIPKERHSLREALWKPFTYTSGCSTVGIQSTIIKNKTKTLGKGKNLIYRVITVEFLVYKKKKKKKTSTTKKQGSMVSSRYKN
jgi:hypothetical protein